MFTRWGHHVEVKTLDWKQTSGDTQATSYSQSKRLQSCRGRSLWGRRTASQDHLYRKDLPPPGLSGCPPVHSRAWPGPGGGKRERESETWVEHRGKWGVCFPLQSGRKQLINVFNTLESGDPFLKRLHISAASQCLRNITFRGSLDKTRWTRGGER